MPWSVFVFLVFFVAATRLEAKGERLEVIGPILCRAGAAASLSSNPSRHFAPFAVKNGLVRFCVSRVFCGHALVGFCAFCAFCGCPAARKLEGRPPLASLGGYFWGRLISPPGGRGDVITGKCLVLLGAR